MKINDNLSVMLMMQQTLQEKGYGYDFSNMTPQQRTAYIKEMTIHINQEMNEMLYELPFFKPWKDYSNMTPEEIEAAFAKARKEMIDFMHFNFNVLNALGMTSEDIYNEYASKNEENYRRQTEGYTHDKSYR